RHTRRCRALFSSLVRRWFAMPPEYESTFVESTRGFIEVQEAFRRDPRLWRLTLGLYPELAAPGGVGGVRRPGTGGQRARRAAAEVHLIVQMAQEMENAWLSLNLDAHYAHPLNRGWMDVFHRWSSARAVREHWPVLRAEFGRGFVSFCERQMRMGVVGGEARRLGPDEAVPELLNREFGGQGPGPPGPGGRPPAARGGRGRRAPRG